MRILFLIIERIEEYQWKEFITALSNWCDQAKNTEYVEVFMVTHDNSLPTPTYKAPDNVRITQTTKYNSPLIQGMLQRKTFARCYTLYNFKADIPPIVKHHNKTYSSLYGIMKNIDKPDVRREINVYL